MSNNFVIVSNQRCGSTWTITSLGNLENVNTDYETKWSNDLLINKQADHHIFLKENSFEKIFSNISKNSSSAICGTKFVFDFYNPLPFNDYSSFLNKFKNVKVIHIKRKYTDILKSKLIGGVSHTINEDTSNKNRKIDNWILNNKTRYLNVQKQAKNKSDIIEFDKTNSFLINLFLNDIIASALNSITDYMSLEYENIQYSLGGLSSFLNLKSTNEQLKYSFLKNPTIRKNTVKYKDSFENYESLKKNSELLEEKIKKLSLENFNLTDILGFDKKNNKIILKI